MLTAMSRDPAPRRMYLVRHAMPVVDPTVASHRWQLDDTGRAAADELAAALPDGPLYWVASTEPKAWQTAEHMAAGAPVHQDPDFGEVRKPHEFTARHRHLASAYLSGTIHPHWEDPDTVAARFGAAVSRHLAAAGPATVVITTHGIALTTWLARHIDLGDAAGFWRGLTLPDMVAVNVPSATT